jgi:hypothetical protein
MRSLTLAILCLCACGQLSPPADVRIENLVVESPGDTYAQRTSVQLRVWGLYSDGHRSDLTAAASYSSNDESVVKVTNDGVALFQGVGHATLTATYGLSSAATRVTSTAVPLASLAITGIAQVPAGKTVQLKATATWADGVVSDVTAGSVWTSSSADATAGLAGVFTGTHQGGVTARATYGGKEATFAFDVTPALFTGLSIHSSAGALHVGDLQPLQLIETLSDGTERDVAAMATWTSSDPTVLSVQAGAVSVLKNGSATISANWETHPAALPLVITDRVIGGVTVSSPGRVAKGLDALATTRVQFTDGSEMDGAGLVMVYPSDSSVATVSASGVVHALAEGSITLRATIAGVHAEAPFTVDPAVLQTLTASLPGGRMQVGQQATFTVTGHYSDQSEVNLTSIANFTSHAGYAIAIANDLATLTTSYPGTAIVQAEVSGQYATIPLEFSTASISSIEVTPKANAAFEFEAFATWSDGAHTCVTEFADWSGDAAQVAAVDTTPGERGVLVVKTGGAITLSASVAGVSTQLAVQIPNSP